MIIIGGNYLNLDHEEITVLSLFCNKKKCDISISLEEIKFMSHNGDTEVLSVDDGFVQMIKCFENQMRDTSVLSKKRKALQRHVTVLKGIQYQLDNVNSDK